MENEKYRQAILDAKVLRASAIANAKASLDEAFAPKIQEMLRLSLSEELETEADMEETYHEDGMEETMHGDMEEDSIQEADLDEILAELDALSEEEDQVDEGEDIEENLNEAEEDEDGEDGDEEEEDEDGEDGDEEEVGDDTKVVDITLGDLKAVIQDLMAGGETGEVEDDMGMSDDMETTDDDTVGQGEDELSLDEILAELEEEGHGDKVEEKKEMKKEGKTISVNGFGKGSKEAASTGATNWKTVKQLKEANKTIEILSEKLQEINLLNAKLLYMNKIFKDKSLNEAQKIKVVKAFDKTDSVKGVKNTYDILKETLETNKKSQLKESFGFASKPAGVAPKRPIVDSDPIADRWSQLVFGNK